MKPLKRNLELLGYDCISPDLELTYKEIGYSALVLEDMLEERIKLDLKEDEKIHLVGHSTGGLVIRKFIASTKYPHRIGRCVLIATPNRGSKLANIAGNVKLYVEIYKTLKSLSYEYAEQLNTENYSGIEIAAIAGDKNHLLLGKLIGDKNDGRVEVQSVYLPNLKDFMILPYGHKEIHHQVETAIWIDAFLKEGKFK